MAASQCAPQAVRTSDSLLASLCREVEAVRQRSQQLRAAIDRCQHQGLLARLRADLAGLQARRLELQALARGWQRRGGADPLALAFLVEISSRPLAV
ncbi:MAG: hypothetical protein FJ054_07610 [Cyanobacteria bacterium M_surface_10_m2_119]|nr:hypothetical protein [Cyanobacteria bacterium M_surface_10_m2_119]